HGDSRDVSPQPRARRGRGARLRGTPCGADAHIGRSLRPGGRRAARGGDSRAVARRGGAGRGGSPPRAGGSRARRGSAWAGGAGGRRGGERGLESVARTFDPHPVEVVNPAAAPRLLTLEDEERELLEAAGVGRVALLPFTAELARLGPEEFTRDVLLARFGMRLVVLGYDHGFGRGRSGDAELVRRLGAGAGFEVAVVEAVRDGGQPVSSTLIRAAVAHGDLGEAARSPGRPYSLRGRGGRRARRGRPH